MIRPFPIWIPNMPNGRGWDQPWYIDIALIGGAVAIAFGFATLVMLWLERGR